MFDGFERTAIDTGDAVMIHVRHGGSGLPLLLLHGIPETHVMWHKIAPRLARHFTVVATDLRGYGDRSRKSRFLESHDVLAVWRDWANDVRGRALDCGHFLAEEAPDETCSELVAFFSA